MAPKVAIIIYSMYGHIATMAEAVKEGIEAAGGTTEIFQVPETLPEEVLAKMHAPPKKDYTIIAPSDLPNYDAYVFGIPTRYGNVPAQIKAFLDATGQLWQQGALSGKYAATFVSNATLGGGQETTHQSMMSYFAHQGIIYVPFGYAHAFPVMSKLDEVHGGSPWGAGTFAAGDGSRQPTDLEKGLAKTQGTMIWNTLSKVNFCLDGSNIKDEKLAAAEKPAAAATTGNAAPLSSTNRTTQTSANGIPQKKDSSDRFCGLKCIIA